MTESRNRRGRQSRRASRALVMALAVLVFAGVIVQITLLARLSGQRKEQAGVEKEIRVLNAQLENMTLSINSFHNLDRIAMRARQLGMAQPEEGQIRVVNLPGILGDTTTQSAEAVGAEEIQ